MGVLLVVMLACLIAGWKTPETVVRVQRQELACWLPRCTTVCDVRFWQSSEYRYGSRVWEKQSSGRS